VSGVAFIYTLMGGSKDFYLYIHFIGENPAKCAIPKTPTSAHRKLKLFFKCNLASDRGIFITHN
jgi:hypothetical protein